MDRFREGLARVATTFLMMVLGCGPLGAGVNATAEALGTSEAEETATQGAVATVTAEAHALATDRANAIGTQRAGGKATRTAGITATAEAAMSQFGVPGDFKLRFYEDFDNSRSFSIWSTYDESSEDPNQFSRQSLAIEKGKYVWAAHAKQAFITWSTPFNIHATSDFYVSVDASLQEGEPASRYGIIFRYTDEDNFYEFDANSRGYYAIYRLRNDYWLELKTGYSEALLPGNSINTLAVLGIADSFTFYINEELVATVKDSEFERGDAGLLIQLPYGGAETIIHFDNFTLLVP
jgi:hypothetical protein